VIKENKIPRLQTSQNSNHNTIKYGQAFILGFLLTIQHTTNTNEMGKGEMWDQQKRG
jgi:hypothetical protein